MEGIESGFWRFLVAAVYDCRISASSGAFLATGLIHHGLLAGRHAEDASLGGCFVEYDTSDDVFALLKHLQVLSLGGCRQECARVGDHRIGPVGLEVAVAHANVSKTAHKHFMEGRGQRDGLLFWEAVAADLGTSDGLFSCHQRAWKPRIFWKNRVWVSLQRTFLCCLF